LNYADNAYKIGWRVCLPCVRGGAERSEAEGLLETKKFAIKLSSRRVFCHTGIRNNYQNWCDRKIVTNLWIYVL